MRHFVSTKLKEKTPPGLMRNFSMPCQLWKKVNQLIPDKSTSNISEIHDETSSVISNKKGEQNKLIFCQYWFKASTKISS